MTKYKEIKKQTKAIIKDAGINCVKITIEEHFNEDTNKAETFICGYYPNQEGGESCHMTLIDKWFEGVEIFSMFFTQRADWLAASLEIKQWCFDQQPMIHPAMYVIGMEPNISTKAKKFLMHSRRDPLKYQNGYAAKVSYWKGQLSNGMIEENGKKMTKALEKLQYFVPKHAAFLTTKKK
tara:strand:+ start:2268 stop:2807 length:540 start_codon:yes stop_codon:yes gene_type:complete